MTLKGSLLPDALGDITASVVQAYNEARLSKAALRAAEQMLTEALGRAEDKVAFLERLIEEAESAGLPPKARQRLIGATYKLLKDEEGLLAAAGHVVRKGQRGY